MQFNMHACYYKLLVRDIHNIKCWGKKRLYKTRILIMRLAGVYIIHKYMCYVGSKQNISEKKGWCFNEVFCCNSDRHEVVRVASNNTDMGCRLASK